MSSIPCKIQRVNILLVAVERMFDYATLDIPYLQENYKFKADAGWTGGRRMSQTKGKRKYRNLLGFAYLQHQWPNIFHQD